MASKRILFLIDTLNTGGAESSLQEILSRFKQYEPVVCHLYPGSELKPLYTDCGIEVISLDTPLPYHLRKAIHSVEAVCRKVQPCLVHSTLFRSDLVSRRVAPRFKLPLVNSLVNNSYHPTRFEKASLAMKLKLKLVQAVDSFTAQKVDLFISNSEAIKISNARALRIPLHKVKVIYRGRSVDKYTDVDADKLRQLKSELGIGEEKVLLNVSRLLERKGQLDLLRAFHLVAAQVSGVRLLIAGEGPFRTVLENEIKTLNLEGRVSLLGTRADVPALLKLAHGFVFPSLYEGLPGALIEAMMARIPIVASGIDENLECVTEDSAFIHKAGDIHSLAHNIRNLLEMPAEGLSRAERAFAVAKDKFEITAISSRYESTYDEMLA